LVAQKWSLVCCGLKNQKKNEFLLVFWAIASAGAFLGQPMAPSGALEESSPTVPTPSQENPTDGKETIGQRRPCSRVADGWGPG
jgi:hypothetical protein